MKSYFKHEVFDLTGQKCRTCKEKKPYTEFPMQKSVGSPLMTRSRICTECTKKRGTSKYKPNGNLRARHKTETKQKLMAFCRDKKCIHPRCTVSELQRLDFHHAFSKPSDKLPRKLPDGTPVDWNKHSYGVMLCRKHHDEVKTNDGLYRFCQIYLRYKHAETEEVLKPVNEEEALFLSAPTL